MNPPPKLICLIGAESTGKTTLAQLLAKHFECPWVPENLREFCDVHKRTPTRDEQKTIIELQVIDEASVMAHACNEKTPYIFSDTAPLLTAIYSDYVFNDKSLYPIARTLHQRYALTLLLAPDIAWVADGQREGAHVRQPITAMIANELAALKVRTAKICGHGDARLASALRAIETLHD